MSLNPISPRRDRDAEDEIRQAVYARDRHRCLLEPMGRQHGLTTAHVVPPCRGPLTPHHRRKAGAGGSWSMENLVTLCAGHNGWVEDEPDDARDIFGTTLVVREGDPEWEELGRRAHRLASD